jgi:hypothetical protein
MKIAAITIAVAKTIARMAVGIRTTFKRTAHTKPPTAKPKRN